MTLLRKLVTQPRKPLRAGARPIFRSHCRHAPSLTIGSHTDWTSRAERQSQAVGPIRAVRRASAVCEGGVHQVVWVLPEIEAGSSGPGATHSGTFPIPIPLGTIKARKPQGALDEVVGRRKWGHPFPTCRFHACPPPRRRQVYGGVNVESVGVTAATPVTPSTTHPFPPLPDVGDGPVGVRHD